MDSDHRFRALLANAERIRELSAAIDAAFKLRESGPDQFAAWKAACAAFHAQYDSLAFPGGYGTARDRIRSGDANAIEAALRFIESPVLLSLWLHVRGAASFTEAVRTVF